MSQSPHVTTKPAHDVDVARVRAAIAPVLVAHGVSVVEVVWTHEPLGWTLRITIERPDAWDASGPFLGAGVSLEDCAEVSRGVSAVLDELETQAQEQRGESLLPEAYHLEVGSPGLDRPLQNEADFRRFRGLLAKVKLKKPASDGQRVLRGTLEAAADGHVAVLVDGKRLEAPYEDVASAHLVYEPFAPAKGSPRKTTKATSSTKQQSTPRPRAASGAPKKS
jgi:ribosome maturation factor RimP